MNTGWILFFTTYIFVYVCLVAACYRQSGGESEELVAALFLMSFWPLAGIFYLISGRDDLI